MGSSACRHSDAVAVTKRDGEGAALLPDAASCNDTEASSTIAAARNGSVVVGGGGGGGGGSGDGGGQIADSPLPPSSPPHSAAASTARLSAGALASNRASPLSINKVAPMVHHSPFKSAATTTADDDAMPPAPAAAVSGGGMRGWLGGVRWGIGTRAAADVNPDSYPASSGGSGGSAVGGVGSFLGFGGARKGSRLGSGAGASTPPGVSNAVLQTASSGPFDLCGQSGGGSGGGSGCLVLGPSNLGTVLCSASRRLPVAVLVCSHASSGGVPPTSPMPPGVVPPPPAAAAPRESPGPRRAVLSPVHTNGTLLATFGVAGPDGYAACLRKMIKRDAMLAFALQNAVTELRAGGCKVWKRVVWGGVCAAERRHRPASGGLQSVEESGVGCRLRCRTPSQSCEQEGSRWVVRSGGGGGCVREAFCRAIGHFDPSCLGREGIDASPRDSCLPSTHSHQVEKSDLEGSDLHMLACPWGTSFVQFFTLARSTRP
eukprot:270746-Chlamydomonas_euryale.AAC.4